ncbi:MAG: DUF4038 domain-containing protein [Bacteroidales bacterium]|nr:DUF4038 domain-containing protein [Bacteroidales bacterium]
MLNAQEVKHNGPSVDFSKGKLEVSANGRFLQHEDGSPFFYLGGTAWELFHRLNREEAEQYLKNRREKGFTVIQAVALAERNGLKDPNPYAQLPLIDEDLTKPNEKYWQHVDYIIDLAASKGMFIGLLPTWGDKVDKQWGDGPVIFNPENAYQYGKWIGSRYKNRPNIIWINGGDRICAGQNEAVWDALGRGIKEVDNNHLMTFHPLGGTSSSLCFQDAGWLDFSMLQTGHGARYQPSYADVGADYDQAPVKPCMDGEPNYEDHAINWQQKFGWFNDDDVRRSSYWSVLAGGHGITYGAHPIWQMHKEGTIPVGDVRRTWDQALNLPGAWDMIHLRRLMESRPYFSRVPDQSVIVSNDGDFANRVVASRGDGYIMAYLPGNLSVVVKVRKLFCDQVKAWWYNPRTGEATDAGTFPGMGELQFTVPVKGIDWVLVIDDAAKGFAAPGR